MSSRAQEIVEKTLSQNGFPPESWAEFLNPDYDKLLDPLTLPDMGQARDRLIGAIDNDEHIFIFSDYDADGIPGATLMSDFFRNIGYENVSFYIPHRHDEGFGLNLVAMEEAAQRGAKLIMTIDCGIADIKEVARAVKLGIDVIITDHHEPNGALPEALAIVNPKLNSYQSELCGSAIVYKLIQAILSKKSYGLKPGMEKWMLDLVGIATLSDMVPLVGENRIFARFGLEVLRKTRRPGLQALFSKLNIEQKHLSEDDITFMITPRINAASRMGVPMDAFKLLSTDNEEEARSLALHLENINNERKGVVAAIVKEAKSHLAMREILESVVVIGNPEWRPALLGLVANSLVEEYKRPVFIWGRDGDGILKGSCRSYNGHNLHSLMSSVGDSFLQFGGHAGAGGFSITLENLTTLEENLSLVLGNLAQGEDQSVSGHSVSTQPLEIREISHELWEGLSLLAPFGIGNPKPIFEIKGKLKSVRQFGKESNHLEVVLTDPSASSRQVVKDVKAISFFTAQESYKISWTLGVHIKLLAHLEKSYFRNRPELRLRIVDIIQE
jgi:single-stranded-DNA-specific exonuclease